MTSKYSLGRVDLLMTFSVDDSDSGSEMDMDLESEEGEGDDPVPPPSRPKSTSAPVRPKAVARSSSKAVTNPYPLEGKYIDEDDRDKYVG